MTAAAAAVLFGLASGLTFAVTYLSRDVVGPARIAAGLALALAWAALAVAVAP